MRNKENVRKLVTALRSGEYQQATGVLCQIDPETGEVLGHCCLGVASAEAAKEGVCTITNEEEERDYLFFDNATAFLPRSVMTWLGTDEEAPEVTFVNDHGEPVTRSLTHLNDNLGKSLPEIADIIEDNFLKDDE